MTLVFLVAIIALAAAGLIVVMLAIARIDDDAKPTDAPSPTDTTPRPQKPPRRPVWHGITQAWWSWRNRHYLP